MHIVTEQLKRRNFHQTPPEPFPVSICYYIVSFGNDCVGSVINMHLQIMFSRKPLDTPLAVWCRTEILLWSLSMQF
jgi:hypothetical protein